MDQPPRKPPGPDDGPNKEPATAPPSPQRRPDSEAPTIQLPSVDAPTTAQPEDLRQTAHLVAPDIPGLRRTGLQTETLQAPEIPPDGPEIPAGPLSEAPTTVMPKIPEPSSEAPTTVMPKIPEPSSEAPTTVMPKIPELQTPALTPPQGPAVQAPAIQNPATQGPNAGRPAPAKRPSRPPSPASSGVRIAARSQADLPRPVAWGAGVVLILLSGLVLWGARQPIDRSLDRWLTLPTFQKAEPVVQDTPQPVQEAAPVEEEDTGPVWDFSTIEDALIPLPDQVQELSTAGRGEQADFADLVQRDAPAALLQSRWDNWRQVWRNRTQLTREAMPPVEECQPHAALEATCVAVHQALVELEGISELPQAEGALEAFDRADAVLEAWHTAKEEEEAAALEAAALAAEAAAQEAQAAGELTNEILDATEGDPLIAAPVEEEDLLPPDG